MHAASLTVEGAKLMSTVGVMLMTGEPVNMARLIRAVALAKEVLDSWEDCKKAGRPAELRRNVDQKTETLLRFMLNSFNGPVSTSDVRLLFKTTEDRLSMEHLNKLHGSAVTISIMIEILNQKKVMFNPHHVPSWKEYSERYGEYIRSA